MKISATLLLLFLCCTCDRAPTPPEAAPATAASDATPGERWTVERARAYFDARPIPLGANYNNRDAINQLEMWQAATFNPAQIDEELGWAAAIGMNSMRVYLHDLLWEQDSSGLLNRMERYLDLAAGHGMSTTFVLFDAVWNPEAAPGPQPAPRPHVHNSGWVQSPTAADLTSGAAYYPRGRAYVQGVLRHFADDDRVYLWDLYNEPDNHNFAKFPNEPEDKADYSFALLGKAFEWAREVDPSQPLTAGVWWGDLFYGEPDAPLGRFNAFQLAHSDLISYHNYNDPERHAILLERLAAVETVGNRPLICTEYLARGQNNTFANTLSVMAERGIGAYNWGLVSGKTNTIYHWDSWDSTYLDPPAVWHHDVFNGDGSPYRAEEVAVIRRVASDTTYRRGSREGSSGE